MSEVIYWKLYIDRKKILLIEAPRIQIVNKQIKSLIKS